MHQQRLTGAFIFQGGESEDVDRYLWATLMEQRFTRKIEIFFRMVFKKPPKNVGYKQPEYYKKLSLEELNRMAGGGY